MVERCFVADIIVRKCHRIPLYHGPVLSCFYTPEVKLCYGMASVCLSVCPSARLSVCPSVSHIMSAQYLENFMSDSHGTW